MELVLILYVWYKTAYMDHVHKPEFWWLWILKHNPKKKTNNSRCLEINLDSPAPGYCFKPASLLAGPKVYGEFDFKVNVLLF